MEGSDITNLIPVEVRIIKDGSQDNKGWEDNE